MKEKSALEKLSLWVESEGGINKAYLKLGISRVGLYLILAKKRNVGLKSALAIERAIRKREWKIKVSEWGITKRGGP